MGNMPENKNQANDDSKTAETVVEQVLAAFYIKLAEKSEYKEVAERLKNETNSSEAAIRLALFGEEGK